MPDPCRAAAGRTVSPKAPADHPHAHLHHPRHHRQQHNAAASASWGSGDGDGDGDGTIHDGPPAVATVEFEIPLAVYDAYRTILLLLPPGQQFTSYRVK